MSDEGNQKFHSSQKSPNMNTNAKHVIKGRVSPTIPIVPERLDVTFVPGKVLHISDSSIGFWVTVDLSKVEQDEYQDVIHPLVGGFVDVDTDMARLFPLEDTVRYPSFRDVKPNMFKMCVSLRGMAIPNEEGGYRLHAEATAHSNSPYSKGEYSGKYTFWIDFDTLSHDMDVDE